MSENIYSRLGEFMDTLPPGFPGLPAGLEIKILKKLVTPTDAEMMMLLTPEAEELTAIAARTGIDEVKLSEKLENMSMRGLIYRHRSGDKVSYLAYQSVRYMRNICCHLMPGL